LSFFAYLEGELERAGFFRPEAKQKVMRRNLRNMFHRMQLTEQDVRTLRGMVVRLVEGPRNGVGPDKMLAANAAAPSAHSSDSLAGDED
jgi:tRNA/rRNA methyltransferase